jgi:multisubunit Na+/H+ antiporter MnhB subunit
MMTGMENNKYGMSLFVKSASRIVVILAFVFGMHIILHGHLAPGGGFAGGVIIALSFVLLVLAFGKEAALSKLSLKLASNLESIGALLFLIVALLGFSGGTFFLNILAKGKPFRLFSAGTIPISNIAIVLKVGVGLLVIFLALVILEKSKKEK